MSDQPRTRPLSPHLQVYNLPMTARMSISHRISGVLLVIGSVLIGSWFVAAAASEEYYNMVMDLTLTLPGQIVLFGWSFVIFYHLCNGIRHLLWDAGFFLNKKGAAITNWLVLLATVILTGATWFCPCFLS